MTPVEKKKKRKKIPLLPVPGISQFGNPLLNPWSEEEVMEARTGTVTIQRLRESLWWWRVKWSEVAQLCLTLCDSMDGSLPGSSVHGIFPGKNTGVDYHFLLQGIFPTQQWNLGLPHCRQTLYCLSHQGSWWWWRREIQGWWLVSPARVLQKRGL